MSENNFKNSIGKPLAGTGLVALWLSAFFVPIVEISTCTQGSEDAWLGSLFVFFPVSLVAVGLAFLGTGAPTRIKWLSLPLFGLLPWAAYIAGKYILGTTLGGNHLCALSTGELGFNSYPSSWWAPFWGPMQLIFVAVTAWCLIRYWWPSSNC
ncbi:hypothetical protein SAMN02745866_00312 [Alteromonadaceae bacterium Bs31]|nr:hypothetical protein SAMN02745866_00312 [Alteromonadaceae bacterium Bs31]